jgi:hypothetical protein
VTSSDSFGFHVDMAASEDQPSAPGAPRKSAGDADLRRLEEYIRRDENSLSRQRAILADCDGPGRIIAEATIAEYEQSLQTLRRRRARLLARG